MKVELREFDLLPNRVTATLKIDARFAFDGELVQKEQASEVRGEADLGHLVSVEAGYRVEENGLHIDCKVLDLKFTVKVRELRPDDSDESKAPFRKIVARQLRRQREELIRDFHDWAAEHTRGPVGVQ